MACAPIPEHATAALPQYNWDLRRLFLFPRYQRDAAKLLGAKEQDEMERHIADDPERHPLIPGARRISVKLKNKPSQKSSGRSSGNSTKLGRVLVESAKHIARHMKGEIELPMKVVRVAPDVDVRAIREGQGLTREQFAERYGLRVRAVQEWEQGRRKPEPAVRAYMLVIKNQPTAVRKALTAA